MPRVNVKDKRRAQLIEANIASIAKRGFTETTIQHVSEGAGMSRGIVNFYFTSKEVMMQETLKFLIHEFAELWKPAVEKTADEAEALNRMVESFFHKDICNIKRLAVWAAFWGHAATHPIYSKLIAKADQEQKAAIAGLRAKVNNTAPEAQEAFAQQLLAMMRGCWLDFLMHPQSADRKEMAALCLGFLNHHSHSPAQEAARLAKPAQILPVKPAAAKAKKPVSDADKQLDLIDLFAVKA